MISAHKQAKLLVQIRLRAQMLNASSLVVRLRQGYSIHLCYLKKSFWMDSICFPWELVGNAES